MISKVTLTFDHGPHREVTDLLDLLGKRPVPSMCFVLGNWMTNRAERVLAERAFREGHGTRQPQFHRFGAVTLWVHWTLPTSLRSATALKENRYCSEQ